MFVPRKTPTPRNSISPHSISPNDESERIITIYPNICVQSEEGILIDGKLGIIEKDSNLFFHYRSNNKPKSKNDYIIVTFLISDIHSFSVTSSNEKYDIVNFLIHSQYVPTFFIERECEMNVYCVMNSLIENGYSVLPKENTVNEFVINKRHANHVTTTLPSTIDMTKIKSIDIETILSYANEDGSFSITAEQDIRKSVYVSGVEPKSRLMIWKLVLGYYEFNMTEKERNEFDKKKEKEYYQIKIQWENILPEQFDNWKELKQHFDQIDKDVSRTDKHHDKFSDIKNVQTLTNVLRTYCMFNYNVGYGQGMNDLCSLLIEITQEESSVFWLFKYVMDIVKQFYTNLNQIPKRFDTVGYIIRFVNPHLYQHFIKNDVDFLFCYKWIVLLFKREFNVENCLRIWDSIFAYPERRAYFFISSAIILEHADEIMNNQMNFDGMVAFLQTLHKKIPAEIVFHSDVLYQQFQQLADKESIEKVYQ
ncbi:Rab-GAP TBC domain-containing protein [Entamoeba marina]